MWEKKLLIYFYINVYRYSIIYKRVYRGISRGTNPRNWFLLLLNLSLSKKGIGHILCSRQAFISFGCPNPTQLTPTVITTVF